MTDLDRFYSKVDKTQECWIWCCGKTKAGYGKFKVQGKTVNAHRWIYKAETGNWDIGEMDYVCHKCDNPLCVRLDHLFLGSPALNMEDKVAKGRQSKGPEFVAKRNHATGKRNGKHTMPEATPRGEKAGGAKLTAKDVLSIRDAANKKISTRYQLAKTYMVSFTQITRIVNRETWKHI